MMYHKSENCIEHPLGILCNCAEYQNVIKKFISYGIGTRNQLLSKVNIEPIASAEVLWINNHMEVNKDISKPIIQYFEKKTNINASNIDKIWIPVSLDTISLKSVKLTWKLW
ncbi:uncharacterized protein LOC143175192 [Nomia melanderi]|uniref:uncharacterized protein LOC143175192 n=1 Tax=Nomia melanderi TaxID=2448451 RepID=UPI003FCD7089